MTDMRRVSIAFPKELDKKILELKKDDRFVRCSYSEIARQAIRYGVSALEQSEQKVSGGAQ